MGRDHNGGEGGLQCSKSSGVGTPTFRVDIEATTVVSDPEWIISPFLNPNWVAEN